jgi:hypothetical protein
VRAGLVPAARDVSLPVHPSQLYEALLGLGLFALVTLLARRPRREGMRFAIACAVYAVGRAALETWRGDLSRGVFGPFSTAQMCGVLVVAGALLWARRPALRLAPLALLFVLVPHAQAQPGPYVPPPVPEDLRPPAPPVHPEPATGEAGASRSAAPVASASSSPDARGFDIALLAGTTAAINRPQDQVSSLLGFGLLGAYAFDPRFGAGAEIELMASNTASHQTFALCGFFRVPVARRVELGFRLGLGATSITWSDPSFDPVVGFDWRLAGTVELALARHWTILVQPVALDVVQAGGIGGALVSYQLRIGLAYVTRRR